MFQRIGMLVLGLGIMIAADTTVIHAGVIQYGDKDLLGTGAYSRDPVTGAALEGLAPGVTSLGTFGLSGFQHSFPFRPSAGDFPGTDQIYVGSMQTHAHDGYAGFVGRLKGPQNIVMDYSSIVPTGHIISTLTLGIGFDDFQRPVFGQPYFASVNGIPDIPLTNFANAFSQTGPRASFGSIGISPTVLLASNVLTLSINQGGTGGDGWAIDFLTIGVTTTPASNVVPEPSSMGLWSIFVVLGLIWRHRVNALANLDA